MTSSNYHFFETSNFTKDESIFAFLQQLLKPIHVHLTRNLRINSKSLNSNKYKINGVQLKEVKTRRFLTEERKPTCLRLGWDASFAIEDHLNNT